MFFFKLSNLNVGNVAVTKRTMSKNTGADYSLKYFIFWTHRANT